MEEHKDIKFTETETFKKARKLTSRTEIARAFNLENRIALKLTLDADDYGDKGTEVKMAYNLKGNVAFEKLELRRFYDSDRIILFGECGCMLTDCFGLKDVENLYEKQNLVTVKDGDKCVILIENKSRHFGFVVTGTIRLPRKSYCQTEGYIELD